MLSLLDDTKSKIMEDCRSPSRYTDIILDIDNDFFDSMVNQIYTLNFS